MKCAFCGTTHEVEERDNEMLFCNDCYNASMEAQKKKEEEFKMVEIENVVEAEMAEEIVEGEEAAPTNIKCEITIGVTETGELYFNAAGNQSDLLTIDGLLSFGRRRMKQVWENREAEILRQAELLKQAQQQQ